MNRLLTILITLFIVVTSIDVTAQNISVSSFQLDETDLTANLKETIVLDQNGNKCALIKINTTQTNFNFDVGVLGVTDVKYYPAQVWLYVPFGVKRISIMHQQLGSLINWEFPIPIESARTYLMQLTTDEVVTTIKKKATSDYIVFNVKPSNALIYLNDEIMQADNGVASKFVPYGKYTYKVVAPGYHAQNGSVSISQKTVVDISLNPAFGFLNVTSAQSLYGAIVFIDGEAVGQIPLNQYQLSSGYHDITITKQYTKPYNQKVKISDSETLDLIYTAIDNFSNIQIEADEATNVFINNRLVSSGEWNGKLESGSYIVEWRKQNYKTAQTELHVNGNKDNIIVNQPLLQPIIGSVNILSSPSNSNVEIDGKFVGMTPMYIDEIMAGEHIVNISKDGYTNVNTSFVVSENETTTLNYDLSSVANVTVKIYPYSDANLIIDGVPYAINSYPQTFILSIGKHTISVGDNIKYKYEIKEYNILSDTELEINIEPTKTYSSELKKAQRHRTRNRVSLPLGMGFTIANLGMFSVPDKNGEDNFGGVFGADIFASLGSHKNMFNFDVGAGYSYIVTSDPDSKGYGEVPIYIRAIYNPMYKGYHNSDLDFYIGAEIRKYFSPKINFSTPVKVGFFYEGVMVDIYYEPCFMKMNASYSGRFGVNFIYKLGF